jgi:sugar phosphate isomerase/epimerase
MDRRTFLSSAALSTAATALSAAATAPKAKPLPICAFSKHFQWTTVAECAKLCAEIGYDAVDLTVRAGGHVLPERVADDLPKAVEAIHAAGLEAPMITAGIVDMSSPHAETIVKTAVKLGIKRYRWGGFRYDAAKPISAQVADYRARSKALADMNKQYGACAMYHTHSGVGQFGASFWDLWLILRDQDNDAISVNYDVGHATVEGGLGGWINSTRLLLPMTRGIAIKDFRWEKDAKGKWGVHWCGLGEGMVNFKQFLSMVKSGGFTGPLQLHMEYDELGGADSGKTSMTISRAEFTRLMKRDIAVLRRLLAETGLA